MASHLMVTDVIFQKNKCLTDPNHYKDSEMTIFHVRLTKKRIATAFDDVQLCVAVIVKIIQILLCYCKFWMDNSTKCFFHKNCVNLADNCINPLCYAYISISFLAQAYANKYQTI